MSQKVEYIILYMHTQGDNLPHQDPKAPHVRFGGEEGVDQRLGRHPPYRQRVSAMSRLDHLSIHAGSINILLLRAS